MRKLALIIICLIWFGFLSFFDNSHVAMAQGIDDVYYSASMCTPSASTTSNAQTDLRFDYSSGEVSDGRGPFGGWYNFDNDNKETLICPVPYDKNTRGKVLVRVVVEDSSNSSTRGNVEVQLCAQAATGKTTCPFPIGNGGTSKDFQGLDTVEVSLNPTVTGSDEADQIRWVWLKIALPDIDSNSSSGNRASGVLGYRVLRVE